MVLENAIITIDPSRATAFESAVERGEPIFRAAVGCHGMAMQRTLGDPARYRLLVTWETMAHHVPAFWESPAFKDWQALVGEFFVEVPTLEYNELVKTYF